MLTQQLTSCTQEYEDMKKKYDDEYNQNKALQHENSTHQRHLSEFERKIESQATEIKSAKGKVVEIRDELSTTKKKLHEHEQTIATINDKLQNSEREIAKLQGFIRDHEQQARTTATEVQRLKDIEIKFDASRSGESAQLKAAHDQNKEKDGEIRKITVELASTKSELSKSNIEIDKVHELVNKHRLLIDNLTREKQDAEDSIALLKKQIKQLSTPQQRVRTPESSEARQVMTYHTPTFQGGSRNGGGGGDDDPSQSYHQYTPRDTDGRGASRHRIVYHDSIFQGGSGGGGGGDDPSHSYDQYAPHDTDGRGDQASVHFAHLLARLRELLGEKPPVLLVKELVDAFEYHVSTSNARHALLRRIRPNYATSRHPMSFRQYLYDYLLEHTSMNMSIQDQLKQLREKGTPDGTDV
jgi:hypothetical protein